MLLELKSVTTSAVRWEAISTCAVPRADCGPVRFCGERPVSIIAATGHFPAAAAVDTGDCFGLPLAPCFSPALLLGRLLAAAVACLGELLVASAAAMAFDGDDEPLGRGTGATTAVAVTAGALSTAPGSAGGCVDTGAAATAVLVAAVMAGTPPIVTRGDLRAVSGCSGGDAEIPAAGCATTANSVVHGC